MRRTEASDGRQPNLFDGFNRAWSSPPVDLATLANSWSSLARVCEVWYDMEIIETAYKSHLQHRKVRADQLIAICSICHRYIMHHLSHPGHVPGSCNVKAQEWPVQAYSRPAPIVGNTSERCSVICMAVSRSPNSSPRYTILLRGQSLFFFVEVKGVKLYFIPAKRGFFQATSQPGGNVRNQLVQIRNTFLERLLCDIIRREQSDD